MIYDMNAAKGKFKVKKSTGNVTVYTDVSYIFPFIKALYLHNPIFPYKFLSRTRTLSKYNNKLKKIIKQ